MTRRRIIGRFNRSKQGGWEGEILTLTIQRKSAWCPMTIGLPTVIRLSGSCWAGKP